jgi:hypothetical protein
MTDPTVLPCHDGPDGVAVARPYRTSVDNKEGSMRRRQAVSNASRLL